MGYYADLIKEKKEKQNSAESHLKGLIGKKFKRDTDLERAVNSSIYTEISDWSHPRMVVFDKYTDEKYILTTEDNNQYGKDQEFWISKVQKANAKEEKENENFHYLGKTFSVISGNFQQVRQQVQKAYWDKVKELEVKLRSAEGSEKQSIEKELREIREGYKETLEEFDRFNNEKEEKGNSLIGLFDDLRPKDEKTVKEYIRQVKNFIRQCEAKSERSDYAKDYRDLNKRAAESYKKDVEKAERWLAEHHNSKDEKDNEDPQIATLRRKALQKIKEAQKKADWYGDTVMQKFEKDITYAEEEDVPELAGMLDRYLPKFEAKVKSFGNEKDEKQNFDMAYFRKMYDEVQELKRKGIKGANIDKYYAAINQYKEAEEQMQRYKETGKSYYKTAADNLKREADQWMREIKASIRNEKEEGYYAKLAEEKASRKN